MPEKRIVFITGVSSGIGQAAARLLAQQGFTVFGTSRNPSSVETMSGVEVLPLDVCSDEAVEACLNTLLKKTGRLDILVNNAGYVLRGAIEETTLEEAKAQFETNLLRRCVMKSSPLTSKPHWWNQVLSKRMYGTTSRRLPIESATTTRGVSGFSKRARNMTRRLPSLQWWPNAFCALSKANLRSCVTKSGSLRLRSFGCADYYQNRSSNRERDAFHVWTSRNRVFLP
jgi:NAD(P)-dependent dehydrogenase (short-subunit alcohol dehydrogenase family)